MTYAVLRARIGLECRARTDLDTEINAAIQSAVAFYQRRRFYFLEARTLTFNTVASQEFYTVADAAGIPNMATIDALTLTINGARTVMTPQSYAELEAGSTLTTNVGPPSVFAYYGQQLRLYPIPDAIYAARASGLPRLAALSADGDENAWTTEAEELIRYRAKADIWLNTLAEPTMAAACKAMEGEALSELLAETRRRMGKVTLGVDAALVGSEGGYNVYTDS